MSWFWNAFGGKNNNGSNDRGGRNGPTMTKQTSVKIQQFEKGERRAGSLVLTKDDIRAMNMQSKIESTQRKIDHQRLDHQDELQALRTLKETLKLQLRQKLNELGENTIYQEVIQNAYLQEGLVMADPGDGTKEAEVLKQVHKSETFDKSRAVFQQQASNELMEVYKIAPRFKEQMGEREAKLVSLVLQKHGLIAQRKELNEQILTIQKKMIAALENLAKEEFQKRYEAIRDGNDTEDGDLVSRSEKRNSSETRTSYTMRVMNSSPKEIQKKQLEDGLTEVVLEEDHANESRIGEVKKKEIPVRSPVKSAATSTAAATAKRRAELAARAAASTAGPAATAANTRARGVPPSRAGASRSPMRPRSDATTEGRTATVAARSTTSGATTTTRRVGAPGATTASRPTRSPTRRPLNHDSKQEEK